MRSTYIDFLVKFNLTIFAQIALNIPFESSFSKLMVANISNVIKVAFTIFQIVSTAIYTGDSCYATY